MQWETYAPADLEDTVWDVIVVGAGMGGSVFGWAMAQRGLKVLFVERGRAPDPLASRTRQSLLRRLMQGGRTTEGLAARGRWDGRVIVRQGGRPKPLILPLGNGPGGSSAIYGAALERFRREDFAGVEPETVAPAPLANRWPVSYDDFRPYYRAAEALLGVRGERDPSDPDDDSSLRPPAPMSEVDAEHFKTFEAAGLRPHRVHVGLEYKPGCMECLGELCPRDCKAEGASRALKPALTEHGAKLLTGFQVERLVCAGARVDGVVGTVDGRTIELRGRVVALAAGALCTPVLLLNSKSEQWPQGVGNANGLVGRGLMFHMLQIFTIWPSKTASIEGYSKTISCRQTNVVDGRKLGGVQSWSHNVSTRQIAEFVAGTLEQATGLNARWALAVAAPVAAACFPVFRRATMFGMLTEDFAYPENRVAPDPRAQAGFSVEYRSTEDLRFRASLFRKLLQDRLGRRKIRFISRPELLNFGHPSGTCRFGASAATSVLTPENQVRGVDNLYVVDASFFPSSAATNPALTIAANALRVADILCKERLGASTGERSPAMVG